MKEKKQKHEAMPIDVLFVEDEKLMRDSISDIIRRRVNKVYVADDGVSGLDVFSKNHPHIVFTDIRMPNMNGLEMLEEIRKIDDSVKVIVISAHTETDYLQKAINLGVDGFLMKPINIDMVIDQISKFSQQIVYQIKANEYENKLRKLNELIFQNRSRAAQMQLSMTPSWLLPEKKIQFSSNYAVDPKNPSGDFFNIIPISETRYVLYSGNLSQHDIKSTLIMITIKMTLDTIIKNELENASPSLILDRLNNILGSQLMQNNIELLVCYIDSDFDFVRYSSIGPVNILQYDTKLKEFLSYDKDIVPVDQEDRHIKSNFDEFEFPFDSDKLNFVYSRNLENYTNSNNKQLGETGIKSLIRSIDTRFDFLIPYILPSHLEKKGYKSPNNDFTLLLFRKNLQESKSDNRLLVTFKSVLTKTSIIRKECEQFVLNKTGIDELAFKVELVISELLTNIIVHGLNNKPDTMVVLSLDINDHVVINVWDKGIPWEIPQLQKDTAFDLVDLDATSGRGIPIIVTLSDNLERERFDKINQTKIYFSLDSEKESL